MSRGFVTMRKFLLTASTLALMAVPGLAADVIVEDAAYDWTGFYAGLNIGYGFGGDDRVGFYTDGGIGLSDIDDLDISGLFGGGQIGWNFQVDSFVFGLEGDLQIADIDDDFSSTVTGIDFEGSSEIDFFGTARLRAGWAVDRILLYATGGLAWADVDYEVNAADAFGNTVSLSNDEVEWGYAVGGGAEFAVSDAWTIKAEYLYIGLGSETLEGNVLDAGGADTGVNAHTEMTPSFHTVKIGFNWQF